jgi:hypothetical protein
VLLLLVQVSNVKMITVINKVDEITETSDQINKVEITEIAIVVLMEIRNLVETKIGILKVEINGEIVEEIGIITAVVIKVIITLLLD